MPRDYKSEYENYHSKSDQKKDRAGRNSARRMLKKKHGNSLLGKDVVCGEMKRELSMYLGTDYDVSHFEALHDLGYLPISALVHM